MWVFDRLSPSVLPPASVFSLLSLCGRLIYFQSLKLYLFSNTILYGPGTVVGTETKAVDEASKKRFPLMEFTFIRKETNKQVNYYYFFYYTSYFYRAWFGMGRNPYWGRVARDFGHIMGKCFKMGGGGKMVNATGTLGQEGSRRSLSQRRLMSKGLETFESNGDECRILT